MTPDNDPTRRDFLETSAKVGAAGAAFSVVPAHVLGGPRHGAPSDLLNVARIGVGGMGQSDVDGMSGENIYARDGGLHPPAPVEFEDGLMWPPSEDGGQLWIGDDGRLLAGTYGQDAVKGGPAPGSNFSGCAAPFTEMILLGNLAVWMGKALEVNPQTGDITNVTVPAEFIRPTYREGWTL